MNRRIFVKHVGLLTATGIAIANAKAVAGEAEDKYPELAKHKISKADLVTVNWHWPRFVGRNGARDVHGQYKQSTVVRLYTDQGAMGWGLSDPKVSESLPQLIGKSVSELITPEKGLASAYNTFHLDFAMFDLMGVIMNQPVYQLLGAKGKKESPVYSGMIYIDELAYKDDQGKEMPANPDVILNNCAWDYNYGYRQLKIKIGRGKNWYPKKEGMDMDINVVKTVYDRYKDKGVDVLVDANNSYTVDETITFLDGIRGLPLYWMEEPFPENIADGRKLRIWMDANGFKKTRYADGEWIAPDKEDVAYEMAKQGVINTYLNDIHAIGITNWIKRMPALIKAGADGSPHTWGDRLKTNYTVHIAAGLGNISTVEGVTCFSDDIDYGQYPIRDGKITVSEAPGFGMKLLKLN